jgi:hypothetical protein
MRALHDPSSGFDPRFFLQCLGCFSACPQMRREAQLLQEGSDLGIVLALLQAPPWWRLRRHIRPFHCDSLNRLSGHLAVRASGALDCEAARDAAAVGEETALGARLAPVGGILAHLCPPRAGLWSSPRPSPASPSQGLAGRRIPQGPVPPRPQRRLLPPTLGTGGEQHCWNRCRSWAARSTDSPGAGQRKWHPWPCDHQPGGGGTPGDGASAPARAVGYAPITRQGYANLGERCLVPYSCGSPLYKRPSASRIP